MTDWLDVNDPDAVRLWLEGVTELGAELPDWSEVPDTEARQAPVWPKWNAYNARQLFTSEAPSVSWVCRDLQLGPGRPCALAGAAGSGKNDTAQALALAVVAGLPAFGRWAVTSGRVVHLTYDMGYAGTQLRYRRLANGLGLTLAQLDGRLTTCIRPPLNLTSDGIEGELCELLEGHTLCVLDNLRDATPGVDENDSRIGNYLAKFGAACERTGCTGLYLHHTPNADPRKLRGSGAILGASGTVWSIEGAKTEPRKLSMMRLHDCATDDAAPFWLVRRRVEGGAFDVGDGESWWLEAVDKDPDAEWRRLQQDGRAAEVLRALMVGPRTVTALCELSGDGEAGGNQTRTMRELLAKLLKLGKVAKLRGDKWCAAGADPGADE